VTSAAPTAARDVLFVYAEGEAGDYGVIRQREERVELGRIKPVQDGHPIHGELVRLEQRAEHQQLFDVEVLYDAKQSTSRSGPPQVATKAYREHWDQIFGASKRRNSGEPS
jgi:hypothetical protein